MPVIPQKYHQSKTTDGIYLTFSIYSKTCSNNGPAPHSINSCLSSAVALSISFSTCNFILFTLRQNVLQRKFSFLVFLGYSLPYNSYYSSILPYFFWNSTFNLGNIIKTLASAGFLTPSNSKFQICILTP